MRFLLTRELGRLARWLRVLGYDTAYALGQETFLGLIVQALREDRIVVTRDKRFKGHPGVRILWITSDRLRDQLKEFLKQLGKSPSEELLFTRCLKCNTILQEVSKESVRSRVPPFVYQTVDAFVRCPPCDQIYWPGTHLKLAQDFLERIR